MGDVAVTDLPSPKTIRWRPEHKASVVAAVSSGRLLLEDACDRYALTVEEFVSWQEAVDRYGIAGLAAKSVQERRSSPRRMLREPAVALLGAKRRARCVIADVSAKGAQIEFQAAQFLPRNFELRCTGTGRSLRVSLVWQRDRHAGVSFDHTAAPWAIETGFDTWLLGERSLSGSEPETGLLR